jgi:hypothetical protein
LAARVEEDRAEPSIQIVMMRNIRYRFAAGIELRQPTTAC